MAEMTESQRVWEGWYSAYVAVVGALPERVRVPCPDCGAEAVRVLFTADPQTRIGSATIWCGACLRGTWFSRVCAPAGAEIVGFDAPEGTRPPGNVVLIPPDPWIADDTD